ncbi:hypothetical protein KNO33_04250 [Taylorella equigenitalis]|uniref:BPSS1780 family membrane protein n=2 Tax=Taylorella equigenitalis TaxID=29575 RepID=UPI00237D2E15|nr:BPSS1780 family membrane protein [Taylorella equigenitalis]WDU45744.1 hypothetical protein KNO33_04250 [Taylorella equigenitalis]WDU52773.1 hypothetical protein KNO31_04260 [Taylorella equigenitalis]
MSITKYNTFPIKTGLKWLTEGFDMIIKNFLSYLIINLSITFLLTIFIFGSLLLGFFAVGFVIAIFQMVYFNASYSIYINKKLIVSDLFKKFTTNKTLLGFFTVGLLYIIGVLLIATYLSHYDPNLAKWFSTQDFKNSYYLHNYLFIIGTFLLIYLIFIFLLWVPVLASWEDLDIKDAVVVSFKATIDNFLALSLMYASIFIMQIGLIVLLVNSPNLWIFEIVFFLGGMFINVLIYVAAFNAYKDIFMNRPKDLIE